MAVPNLTAIARAVDGDDHFRMRVDIAARYFGRVLTDHMLVHVAVAVEDGIEVDEHGTVSTEGIADDAIVMAVQNYVPPAK